MSDEQPFEFHIEVTGITRPAEGGTVTIPCTDAKATVKTTNDRTLALALYQSLFH